MTPTFLSLVSNVTIHFELVMDVVKWRCLCRKLSLIFVFDCREMELFDLGGDEGCCLCVVVSGIFIEVLLLYGFLIFVFLLLLWCVYVPRVVL